MQLILILIVLVAAVNSDYYKPEPLSKRLSPEAYQLFIFQDGCHELYGADEVVSGYSCRWLDFSKVTCFNPIDANKNLFEIRTPTNESVHFINNPLQEKLVPDGCYKVFGQNDKKTLVCETSFGKGVTGITTPDNYTILFKSPSCETTLLKFEINDIKTFVESYSFDAEARSCYKVYDSEDRPSPYTCLRDYVPESCVYQYNSSCLAITTSKNDTLLLECKDQNTEQDDAQHKCFTVIAADGELHKVCQNVIGEWCIGLEMPSKLTVLLECSFCQYNNPGGFGQKAVYNKEESKNQRKFVKNWLFDDYSGTKKHFSQIELVVVKPDDTVVIYPFCSQETFRKYPYWLPNTDCWGVDVNEQESITLECISSSKRTPGCFNILSNGVKNEVCLKVIQEKCVGLKTPLNYTLILDCYGEANCFRDPIYQTFGEGQTPEEFRKYPVLGICDEVYYDEPTDKICEKPTDLNNHACVKLIQDEGKPCYGVTTPKNETILYLCLDEEKQFITGQYYNRTSNCYKVIQADGTIESVCHKKIGQESIGITTSKNSSIILASKYCDHYETIYVLDDYKKFSKNFKFDSDIRSCYKVYKPNESVSPFTCLNREIHDACLENLEHFENCLGIITQHNETVLLNCKNRETLESGCFEVYAADGTRQVSCQKELEARCVGITTPSNLSVLFECITCSKPPNGYLPGHESRKGYRKFISTALEVFKTGSYKFNTRMEFKACDAALDKTAYTCSLSRKGHYVHSLQDHDNCLGMTLPNLETIIFECADAGHTKTGCFDVFSPVFGIDGNIVEKHQKVGSVCAQYLTEDCVGLITPKNWVVPLACFNFNVFVEKQQEVPFIRPMV